MRISAVLLPALLTIASAPAGCQAADPVTQRKAAEESPAPAPEPAEQPPPARNPHPGQVVRIHGRLPAHLRMALYHIYRVDSIESDCAPLGGRGTLVIPMPLALSSRAKIRHEGDRFETELVVDKYLPGKCGWKYSASRANFWKASGKEEGMPFPVLDGSRYHVDDSVPQCPGPPRKDGRGCREERAWRLGNHDEGIPVQVRCKTKKSEGPMDEPDEPASWYFDCQNLENDHYKKEHLIMPFTRRVELNVYDLDVDPDPLQKELKP